MNDNNTMKNDQVWSGLAGPGTGYAIAQYYDYNPVFILVIANDNFHAQQLENQICFFSKANNPNILMFPDWETLPYDSFSPHEDIISERLSTLAKLSEQK